MSSNFNATKVVVRFTRFNDRRVNRTAARKARVVVLSHLCSVLDVHGNHAYMTGRLVLPKSFWMPGGCVNYPALIAAGTKVRKFQKVDSAGNMKSIGDSVTSHTWEGHIESRNVYMRYRDLPPHQRPRSIRVIIHKAKTDLAKSPAYGLAI